MIFQCINILQVPWEASGLGFQHLSRHMANVNALKSMLDPYNDIDPVQIDYVVFSVCSDLSVRILIWQTKSCTVTTSIRAKQCVQCEMRDIF